MTGETKESVVGGIVLVGLILVIALLQGYSDLTADATADDYPLDARFNRVDGLLKGSEVRLGGIRIGTVERQRLDSNYQAVVTMRIDSAVRLPLDTSAAIHTDGLFGPKYVVIEPGGDEESLGPGDEITFTQDAVVIGDLLELIITQGKMNRKKFARLIAKGKE